MGKEIYAGLNSYEAGKLWTVKFTVNETLDNIRKWNDCLVTVYERESTADYAQVWKWSVDIQEINDLPVLVLERKMPKRIEKMCRDILKAFGYSWKRVVYLDDVSNTVTHVYQELQEIMRKHANKRDYTQDWYYAKRRYEALTENLPFAVWAQYDPIYAEEYKDYFEFVKETMTA